ncbi:MAG TPA: M1 family metallopeptidase [Gemmatimonadaceae bacterium]|nr:M1 family metallopeptidase [Gemmatimonadaceae bacterium]
MTTAKDDYRVRAVGGPADGYGQNRDCTGLKPAATCGPARSPYPVVFLCSLLLAASSMPAFAQTPKPVFTHADTLRGSNTPERSWWDVAFYDLHVKVNPADSSISGYNAITYRILKPAREMQIDLQVPLVVDSIVQDGTELSARRDGNAFFVRLIAPQRSGSRKTISVYYHGKPTVALRPPWDGGFVWARDSLARLWIATADEGLGASVYWPNKDIYSDEPDSQRVAITVPDSLIDVSNGRLRSTTSNADGTTTYEWFVASPINNYDVAVNAAHYAHFSDAYEGERGKLTLDFYPLDYHVDTAKKQFQQVKPMLQCFESWFGPYPWYADGYKLVETPHLGMEHQSAVAYGNHYKNGYLGNDRSGTGHGLKFDFIIVHESAHEWWGNSLTMKDAADMWIHEAFATYAEGLFTECQYGKKAGAEYIIGQRKLIRNVEPIIGVYGVNHEGSGDMYPKGGNILHTIRQLVNDDTRWRGILRGLNKTYWHQTVSGKQVEDFITRQSGVSLGKVFDQYLRTTMVPTLEYKLEGQRLSYRWSNVVPGFAMPVKVRISPDEWTWIKPSTVWEASRKKFLYPENFLVDENFYVVARNILKPADSTTVRKAQ